jgi:Rps23 Pro-64 3,4-dihydroxylase Tpa1-like proline 4-hydroxylase
MLLDYSDLGPRMLAAADSYCAGDPFPHIALDNFVSQEVVAALLPHFPTAVVKAGQEDRSADMTDGKPAQFRKRWVSREAAVNVALRRLYWELNSARFVSLLEQMTGIDNLIPDPYLLGGGVHQTLPGGFLRVHADFNKHPEVQLDRRLNLLIYFNQDWQESWGGNLELWNQAVDKRVHSIPPLAGRCVIFNTTSSSFHGHPEPLQCPAEVTRKSIALYYYTNGRPEEEGDSAHDTLWQNLPGESA